MEVPGERLRGDPRQPATGRRPARRAAGAGRRRHVPIRRIGDPAPARRTDPGRQRADVARGAGGRDAGRPHPDEPGPGCGHDLVEARRTAWRCSVTSSTGRPVPVDLDAVRALAKAATPGPWLADPTGTVVAASDVVPDGQGGQALPAQG